MLPPGSRGEYADGTDRRTDGRTTECYIMLCARRSQRNKPVFEKTCAATQKNVKSHVFLDFEKQKRKNVKKRTCVVSKTTWSRRLLMQLPKVSNGKSPTSNILLRNADTRNYATWNYKSFITTESFEAKISIDTGPTFSKHDMFTVITEWSMWTHFEGVRTKRLLTTFLHLFRSNM